LGIATTRRSSALRRGSGFAPRLSTPCRCDAFGSRHEPENIVLDADDTQLVDTQEGNWARLRQKFPAHKGAGPATTSLGRQTESAGSCGAGGQGVDLILVVGSPNRLQSNRLGGGAQRTRSNAQAIDSAQDIDVKWSKALRAGGLTAGGASPRKCCVSSK